MGVPQPQAYACIEPLDSSGQRNPVRSGAACFTATSPATVFAPGPACIGLRGQRDSQERQSCAKNEKRLRAVGKRHGCQAGGLFFHIGEMTGTRVQEVPHRFTNNCSQCHGVNDIMSQRCL